MLGRRRFTPGAALLGAAPLLAAAAPTGPAPAGREEWDAFKSRFLQPDGRVVDSGNANVSHTEGQGWGMFFAQHHDDPAAFVRIWEWTAATLKRPNDALHAWRYEPGAANPVADMNNATDGDLFIAAALCRAARRWNQPAYANAAAAIGHAVLHLLVRKVGGRTVLLPGVQGFQNKAGTVVNPSYYAFPAMQEVAACAPSPSWALLEQQGLALMEVGRFGRWRLQPDWLLVSAADGGLAPAPAWPPRFSFDAIRVPLYLAWSRLTSPALAAAYGEYWEQHAARLPGWVDLVTDAEAPYAAPPGIAAVAMLSKGERDLPSVAAAPDYYSAALILLARTALGELQRGATPDRGSRTP